MCANSCIICRQITAAVCIVRDGAGYGPDSPGFETGSSKKFFASPKPSREAMGPPLPSVQSVSAVFLWVKAAEA
jgi:hypothetical protein